MNETAVWASGLRKRFGRTEALAGVDLEVARGTVCGLLGPNGAGKTTLVRILATLSLPDAGQARVAGCDVVRDAGQVRYRIGLAGQHASMDEKLTGRDNLTMFGRLYRLPAGVAARRAGELLERFDLTAAGDRIVKTYSGGMRRRIDLISSLIIAPPVLFLDEPTTGLDPRSRGGIWATIRELVDDGTTVLLTTQYLEEADQLADRITIIDSGVVAAEGTPADLKATIGERLEVTIETQADLTAAAEIVEAIVGTPPVIDRDRRRIDAPHAGPTTRVQIIRDLDQAHIPLTDIALRTPTLDEVFLRLTAHPDDLPSRS